MTTQSQAANVVVGPMRIYYSDYGATLPANTLAVDGSWPAGWTELAKTKDSLKLKYEFEVLDITIEQELAPIGRVKTSEAAGVETVMTELTLDQVQLAFGGTVSDETTPAREELTLGGAISLPVKQWGFEGAYYDSSGSQYPVRLFIWKGTASAGGELEFAKSDYAGTPLMIGALADTTKTDGQKLLKIVRVTGA